MDGTVAGLHRSAKNTFSKGSVDEVALVAGVGVDGDAHAGPTVMHRSRRQRDASQPNLRQVHLIATEIHDGLNADGFDVPLGAFGENITTGGIVRVGDPIGVALPPEPHQPMQKV